MSHLLAYVHYEWENEIREDILFCKEFRTTTTAKNVFDSLDNFMRNNEINWTNCIGVCTDGATVMTGRHAGVVQRIKAVATHAVSTHCCLQRDALAAKDIEPGLHEVMNTAVTTVCFVKARATNSRLFTALCEEVGADHHSLFMHIGVRWLSRGRMFTLLLSLREELCIFFIDLSDGTMRARFKYGDEFQVCHDAARKVLIPFSTTYPCEAGFSAMTALKTKYRAKLTIEDDMQAPAAVLTLSDWSL